MNTILGSKAAKGLLYLVLVGAGAFADNLRVSNDYSDAINRLASTIEKQQAAATAQEEKIARIQEGQSYVLLRLSRIEDQLDGRRNR